MKSKLEKSIDVKLCENLMKACGEIVTVMEPMFSSTQIDEVSRAMCTAALFTGQMNANFQRTKSIEESN